MPNHDHLAAVARFFKKELDGRAFMTVSRSCITKKLREESGEPKTRIKSTMAEELTKAFTTQGVLVYPPLDKTTARDYLRLYRADTYTAQLIDIIVYPGEATDRDLGHIMTKLKGKWNRPRENEAAG